MLKIFLSYARADGSAAAARLGQRLQRVGYDVFQDVENLRAGAAWREQLGQALKTTDVVLVLLTPKAVESKYVEWEWTTALFVLNKTVIPIRILPCVVSDELSRLHYRDFSQPETADDAYDALLCDLNAIQAAPRAQTESSAKYKVIGGKQNVIGDNALGILGFSPSQAEAITAEKLQRLRQLEQQINTEPYPVKYELHDVKESIIGDNPVGVFASGSVDSASLLQEIRTMFEASENRVIGQLIAQLSRLEAGVLADIRNAITAVETDKFSDQELSSLLNDLRNVMKSLLTQKALYEDVMLAAQVQELAAVVDAPGTDVRHRLKVTVPIIPLLLAYEGEIEFNIRANLEALWKKIKR